MGAEESASAPGVLVAHRYPVHQVGGKSRRESSAQSPNHRQWKALPTIMYTNEIWLPVTDYEGLYSISSTGRLRSEQRVIKRGEDGTVTNPEKILATPPNHDGYPVCTLHRHGQQTSWYIHTLVARAFYGEPRPRQEVRHLNDVKGDCRVENLAWGTRSENVLDSVRNGTHPQASRTACVHGHEFTEENTARQAYRPTTRVCMACRLEASYRYRARLSAKTVAA